MHSQVCARGQVAHRVLNYVEYKANTHVLYTYMHSAIW